MKQSKIKVKNFTKHILLLITYLLIASNLISQNTISRESGDYSPGQVPAVGDCTDPTNLNDAACIIILPPATPGVDYDFLIPLKTGVDRGNIDFMFTPNTTCHTGTIEFNNATYGNGSIYIPGSNFCTLSGGATHIEIELETIDLSNDNEDAQKYWIPILRTPVKVALVLDISGSMGWTIPGGTEIRWDVLKKSVDEFTNELEAFQQEGDSIGLTYFTTDVIQPLDPIADGFIYITPNTDIDLSSDTILYDMNSRGPLSATAMGLGLQDAIKKLKANSPIGATKIVLLFTDGLQNQYPEVLSDGVSLEDASKLNNSCNVEDSIKYYTVGMGTNLLVPAILAEIAGANKGIPLQTTTGDAADFAWFFANQFSDMLSSGSPQIVDREIGLLENNEKVHKLTLNGNISKILIKLNHEENSEMSLNLKKGETDLTDYCQLIESPYYKMLSLELPVQGDEYITSEGDWDITVNGNSEEEYYITSFADDHFLNYECNIDNSLYTVGDTINFSVDLSYAGISLESSANSVKVVLLKPGEDIGHLLATYATPNPEDTDNPDEATPAEEKLLNLLNNNEEFYEALLPQEQIIELSSQGNGKFTGKFTQTDLTGIYQILYQIKGEIPSLGNFERLKQISTVFEFGQLDVADTEVEAVIEEDNSNDQGAPASQTGTVTIKPVNKFGKYIGPGFLSKIKFHVDKKQGQIRKAKDNLDGSYTFSIVNIPADIVPDVKITVMDELLFEGNLDDMGGFNIWKIIITIILLIILLLINAVKSKNAKKILKTIVWILVLIWLLYMVLLKYGII